MTILSELKPRSRERMIDLVGAAGVDVTDWSKGKGGEVGAATNPKYCYDWAFIEPAQVVVLTLWYDELQVDGDRIVRKMNPRKFGGAGVQRARALRQDRAIRTAYESNLPIRAIICDGKRRAANNRDQKASSVQMRLLDPVSWVVTGYDTRTGACTISRGLPTGEREQNPAWLRDELIVALDFYIRHRNLIPGKASSEIAELSSQMNSLAKILHLKGGHTFRNANGVYMKLMNFRRLDPEYTSTGGVGLTRGGKVDELVWNEFAKSPERLKEIAATILAAARHSFDVGDSGLTDSDPDIAEALEGRLFTVLHRARERSRKLVREKKSAVLKSHGRLACEVCSFDFEKVYGDRGYGFAECHHTKPIGTYSKARRRVQRTSQLSVLIVIG